MLWLIFVNGMEFFILDSFQSNLAGTLFDKYLIEHV